jgi:hypothetical protein
MTAPTPQRVCAPREEVQKVFDVLHACVGNNDHEGDLLTDAELIAQGWLEDSQEKWQESDRERDALKAYVIYTNGLPAYEKLMAALSSSTSTREK